MTIRIAAGPGLTLIQLRTKDAEPLFELIDRNREHLSQHLDDTSEKYPTYDSVLESIVSPKDTKALRFGIWAGDTLAGFVKFKRRSELGYWIGREFQGQGYITRAASALCDYGFKTLKLNSIVAFSHKDNVQSHNVLKRIGFECRGPTIIPSKGMSYSPTSLTFVLRAQ